MIKRVYTPDALSKGDDYYIGKINAYMKAYGGECNFCFFYVERGSLAAGNIMLLNDTAVVSAGFADKAELEEFLMMYSPSTVECPRSVSNKIRMNGYEPQERCLFRINVPMRDAEAEKTDDFKGDNVSLQEMFMILNQSFSGLSYDGWYADMSHRVRHGISRVYTYKDCSCACLDFTSGKNAFISSVAVSPAERGKGTGRELMAQLERELKHNGLQGFVWADKTGEGFYRKLRYTPADEDIIFIRKKTR